jgi:hypothetical protein
LSENNGGDGFFLRGANGASFSHLSSIHNKGNGVRIEGMIWNNTAGYREVYSGGCWLSDFSAEVNTLDGVQVGGDPSLAPDLTGSSVRDGWLEGNKGDGVNISAANTLVSGLRIVGGLGHGDRAVRVRATALGAVVHGIRAGGTSNYTDHYSRILVEANETHKEAFDVSQGNFNMCK